MMKRNFRKFAVALGFILAQTSVHAGTGNLFNVASGGETSSYNITLCLNASAQVSCQNYPVSGLLLSILTIPIHMYPNAGIRVNTAGFNIESGCTPLANGFCSFPVSNTIPANIVVTPAAILFAVTGLNGSFENTLFTVNTSNAFPTFVMPLNSGGDGSLIASDGNTLYHFTFNEFESMDLNTLTTTNIPLSGASYSEPYGAVFFNSANAFLVQKRSSREWMSVTTNGVVTFLASTHPDRKRGFACYQHNIYGVKFESPFELNQMNPADGSVLSTVPLTVPGHSIDNVLSLTVNPNTGVFYVLVKIDGNDIRTLATINIITGVATVIGDIDDSSGLFVSSIAFHPADASC